MDSAQQQSYVEAAFNRINTPEIILPAQHFAALKNLHQRAPEIRLMAKILTDALDLIRGRKPCESDRFGGASRKARQRESAYQWLRGYVYMQGDLFGPVPDDPERLYSCASICGYLGLDFSRLKEAVEKGGIDFKLLRSINHGAAERPASHAMTIRTRRAA